MKVSRWETFPKANDLAAGQAQPISHMPVLALMTGRIIGPAGPFPPIYLPISHLEAGILISQDLPAHRLQFYLHDSKSELVSNILRHAPQNGSASFLGSKTFVTARKASQCRALQVANVGSIDRLFRRVTDIFYCIYFETAFAVRKFQSTTRLRR